ncbi:MAG TPA: hypothetical protein VFZ53_24895 [Polyangiaceae bacterium]
MARFIVQGIFSSRTPRERRAAPRPMRPASRRALRAAFVMMTLTLAATAVVAGSSVAPPGAGPSPVTLGEVSGKTAAGEYGTSLRSAVAEALEQAKLSRPRERFVLSASLERLEAKRDGRRVTATAVVSMVLRREKEQTLHAILRGNATAEESDETLDSTRETALRAAVESAMRRLPEAVKR